jgi:hypothetical protein
MYKEKENHSQFFWLESRFGAKVVSSGRQSSNLGDSMMLVLSTHQALLET